MTAYAFIGITSLFPPQTNSSIYELKDFSTFDKKLTEITCLESGGILQIIG